MSASDIGPSRLEEAKKRINALIDQMTSEHQAMIVSFSESAKVVQTFTDNKNLLRAKLKLIEPTTHTSSLEEALRAASGIANPSRTGNQAENPNDTVNVQGVRTEMYILSDGGFRTIPNFSLGNLEPKYIAVGKPEAKNIAITAFSTERNPDKPGQLQAFARIENFSPDAATVEASLSLNGQLLDAQSVNLTAREERPGVAGVQFDLDDTEGILKVEINSKDHLAYDNTAFAVLNPPRPRAGARRLAGRCAVSAPRAGNRVARQDRAGHVRRAVAPRIEAICRRRGLWRIRSHHLRSLRPADSAAIEHALHRPHSALRRLACGA